MQVKSWTVPQREAMRVNLAPDRQQRLGGPGFHLSPSVVSIFAWQVLYTETRDITSQ